MSYRAWIEGECCGVCGKAGDPALFDGGLIACCSTVRWVCSRACYNSVRLEPHSKIGTLRTQLNETLLRSYNKDELLDAIRRVVPIANDESRAALRRLADSSMLYVEEIREAARKALAR